jgi:hypothetical protein
LYLLLFQRICVSNAISLLEHHLITSGKDEKSATVSLRVINSTLTKRAISLGGFGRFGR